MGSTVNTEYLLVRKSILPDYMEKVVQARYLLASGEVSTVTDAVRRCGISRNTYYKYKDSVFLNEPARHTRHAVLSLIIRDEPGALAAVINQLTGQNTSVLTISQAIPVASRANVLVSVDISEMACSMDELLKSLKSISSVRSVHLDAIDQKESS